MKTAGKKTTEITCPDCGHKSEVEVPEDFCLAFYECPNCRKRISTPVDGECCVVCAYSPVKCPANTGGY